MEEEQQKESIDDTSTASLPSAEQDTQTIIPDNSQPSSNSQKVKTNSDLDIEPSNSPKKQKTIEETTRDSKLPDNSTHIYHQDNSFNENDVGYRSFSTTNKKPSESTSTNPIDESTQSNPIQEILNQASTVNSDPDSDEDEQQKKIIAARKLLFPSAVATSFTEVVDTLRDERRQEFCPIYNDETPEQISLRQAKRKPVGSLLAKRIRWDDLKRQRENEDQRQAQMQVRYGPYGPIYNNQQQQSSANPYAQYYANMHHQPQQSFANPYEQYYATMQNQYEQMVQMTRAQQEYQGFWPEYPQQSLPQNNNQIAQNPMQQSFQPYTHPYPAMYSSNMPGMNTNLSSTYTSADYNSYLSNLMQPPPPPPDEPYPN